MEPTRRTDPAAILRVQFQALRAIGQQLSLDDDRQRRVLLIDRRDWPHWSVFLRNGPMPAQPAVPAMLQRLAAATFRLAALAERQAARFFVVSDPRSRGSI
jgi:hypothetical protein